MSSFGLNVRHFRRKTYDIVDFQLSYTGYSWLIFWKRLGSIAQLLSVGLPFHDWLTESFSSANTFLHWFTCRIDLWVDTWYLSSVVLLDDVSKLWSALHCHILCGNSNSRSVAVPYSHLWDWNLSKQIQVEFHSYEGGKMRRSCSE